MALLKGVHSSPGAQGVSRPPVLLNRPTAVPQLQFRLRSAAFASILRISLTLLHHVSALYFLVCDSTRNVTALTTLEMAH